MIVLAEPKNMPIGRAISPCEQWIFIYSYVASMEYLFHLKHTVKIVSKSEHFPVRYGRKREWCFFSERSVVR